ncbi:MAG: glutaredoxin family protein [Ilumatobacter sp.]|jgi:mycoredoxin|uniref:glutaredoxin family protein n=1 Tax=Ilumatobacter sp. TaxID=1967498 RepID=UPI00391D8628
MTASTPTQVDLYWRPGCGFCSSLIRQLDKLGIDRVEHNIWEDPAAAEIVRTHANGNETVPTVVIGEVGMVNPSAAQLAAHLAQHAPDLLPDGYVAPEPGPVGRALGKIFG